MQEMTEADARVLRAGLRMLARMIARRHLALQSAAAADNPDEARTPVGTQGADSNGEAR